MSHALFDPLGFVAPVLLEPKLQLKGLSGHNWDDAISQKERKRWKTDCCLSLIWRSCLFLAVLTQQGVAATIAKFIILQMLRDIAWGGFV